MYKKKIKKKVVQVHIHITSRIEKVLIKSESVLKCWNLWLSYGFSPKNGIEPTKVVVCGTLLNHVNVKGFL